jgi:pimeloyl-ACP methyl ester carboxylesterase
METFTNGALQFELTDVGPAEGETVILLHGFPADRHCWDGINAIASAAGYRCLAPDLRGYSPGARPINRRDYTTAHVASDVLALADQAGADRFHLVGHDWGAVPAWYLAARQPKRVRSLSALSVPHPEAFARALVTSSQLAHSWYMAFFQLPAVPEAMFALQGGRQFQRSLERSGLNPQAAGRYAARARDRQLRGPLNWYRALPFGGRDRTGPVTVPTLLIWGDRDRFCTRAAAEGSARYVTGDYRFEVLAGSTHWLPEDDAAAVANLLIARWSST